MSITNIANFFGAYPSIKKDKNELFNPQGKETFADVIYSKNEFYENKLDKYEEKPTKPGTLMKHQKNISRYLSSHTLYDSLLAVHQPGTGKCVHPDTQITMANGDKYSIKNLWFFSSENSSFDGEGGEWNVPIIPLYVMSYDPNENRLEERKVLKLYREIFKEYLAVIKLTNNIQIKMTHKHKLLTKRGWIEGKNLSENDKILNSNMEEISIKEINHTFYIGLVYDLEVEGTHTYLANDLITHNTCSAIATAEQLRKENSTIRKALVLVRGKALIENFINELVFVCTEGQYIPEDYSSLTALEKVIRIKKKISDYYTFETFEVFSKKIQGYSDVTIKQNYNNSLIIIDEVHNLRYQGEEKNIYNNIHRFLHTIENYKILLLSGTPMKDQPQEIATVMNLILPINFQLPIEDEFVKKFLIKQKDDTYTINDKTKPVLKSYFKGRVSYLKAMKSNVKKEFQGEYLYNLEKLKVYPDNMSKFQSKIYKNAFEKDKGEEAGIYSNSRQASLFVFPDESYGQEGFKKYIVEKKNLAMKEEVFSFSLTSEFKKEFENLNTEEKLEKLAKFSTKYANTIRALLNKNEACFVYCDFVEGSGAILFSKLLELFGFSKSIGNSSSKGLRYSIITTKTTSKRQIRDILKEFNEPRNKFGEYTKVIIGSRVIGEGFSLKNIQQVHILTPYWNYSETDQAIARAIRLFSHKDLEEAGFIPVLRIYQHVSLFSKYEDSIDLIMYSFSEKKDISIKQVERVIKESSFDCALNYERNILPVSENNSRDCDYTVCKYKCDDLTKQDEIEIDYDTYNLFYAREKVPEIKEKIKKIFSEYFILNFEFILQALNNYSDYEVLLSLKEIVNNSEIIIDKYGFRSYLKEQNNSYYLDNELINIKSEKQCDNNINYYSYFYTKNPTVYQDVNFKNIVNKYYADKIPGFIDEIFQPKDVEKIEEILRKLPLLIQELLLESCYIAKEKKMKENVEVRSIILSYYSPYIYEIDNKIVSSLLLKQFSILKCYNKLNWSECDISFIDKLKNRLEKDRENLADNPYGCYGIYIQDENKFLIRDTSTEEKAENVDKRKQTSGRVCLTWDKKELLKLIMKLEFDYEDKDSLLSLTKDSIIELIGKKYKYASKTYTSSEIEKMSKESLVRLVFWSSKSKNVLCDQIEKWFRDKNLLEIN